MTQPVRLVLLRHGQSEWNAAGIFTGWENAHPTARGEAEAARAGSMLAEHGVLPAFAHTSFLHRNPRAAICRSRSRSDSKHQVISDTGSPRVASSSRPPSACP